MLVITVFIISACSDNTNYEVKGEKNTDLEFQQKDFFCGAGHHLELTFFEDLVLFKKGGAKKGTCGDGFGFCFGWDFGWNIDCVPNTITTAPKNSNVSYNSATQEIKALGIADASTKEFTFYFHQNIENSPNHNPSDFASLDVGEGIDFDGVKLTSGSYPKIVDGIFFKYIVPYAEK